MSTNKLIASLCYFSIFFAGFIFPIAVYFIVDDLDVKDHAKSALLSHLLPLFSILLLFLPLFFIGTFDSFTIVAIITALIIAAINIAVVIWNIIKGIKVLRNV